jgi:hypothetical protein
MDQAQISQRIESSAKKNTNRFAHIIMPWVVILMAVPPISVRWHTYDWLSKFLAIFFLVYLVSKSILDVRVEAKGQQAYGRLNSSLDGCILAMLAILLFAGR